MPKFRVDAHTEQRYIATVEAGSEADARRTMIELVRAGAIEPLVCGFTKIDVTAKDTGSL